MEYITIDDVFLSMINQILFNNKNVLDEFIELFIVLFKYRFKSEADSVTVKRYIHFIKEHYEELFDYIVSNYYKDYDVVFNIPLYIDVYWNPSKGIAANDE